MIMLYVLGSTEYTSLDRNEVLKCNRYTLHAYLVVNYMDTNHCEIWGYRTNAEFSTIQTDPETRTRTIYKNKTLQFNSVRFHLSLTYFALEISSHHVWCSLKAKNALVLYWCSDLTIISPQTTRSLYILLVFHRSKTQYFQFEIPNPHDTITKKSIFLVHSLQFKIILFQEFQTVFRVCFFSSSLEDREFDPYTTKWCLKFSAKCTVFGDQQNSKESRDTESGVR